MNDRYFSSCSRIQPKDILSYLKRFGSVEHVGPYRDISEIYEVAKNRFLIPKHTDFDDYPEAIAQLIIKISQLEKMSFDSVLDALELASVDILSFRNASSDTEDGNIPLWQCQQFIQGASDMLSAVSCSASSPKRSYSGKRPQEAEEFFRKIKFGQTQPGSFIINLRCPTEPEFNTVSIEDELPLYANRVLPLLDTALASASRLAREAMARDDISELVNHPELGLSSNFFDALTQLQESVGKGKFEIKTIPAINRKHPFMPEVHRFNGEYFECYRSAARQIRESEPAPDQTVCGPVVHIDQKPESDFKSVTIRDITGTKPRDILVCLKDDDYNKLYPNFRKDIIKIIGTIQFSRGKKPRIMDYSSLEIVQDER